MRTSYTLFAVTVGLSWALIITLLLPSRAYGQLSLEAILPSHGAENVSTELDVVLRFTKPLDTSVRFEDWGGLYVGLAIYPDPGESESTVLSPDQRELTLHFQLPENTTFRILVTGAKSTTGDMLDRPYASTFSTGTLPTGSVSGTVHFDEGEPANAMVVLMPTDFFAGFLRGNESEGQEEDGLPFRAATIVTDPAGNYKIDHVEGGTYFLSVLQFVDLDDIEGIGFYDAQPDGVPDMVEVASGAGMTGIDVDVRAPTIFTARTVIDAAMQVAQDHHPDAALSSIGGRDLSDEGEGFIWVYGFHSSSAPDTFGVVAFFHLLYPLDDVSQGPNSSIDPTSEITVDWVDTDVVLAAARAAGGEEFAAQHPGYLVDAVLFNADLLSSPFTIEGKLSTLIPVWMVYYYADEGNAPLVVFVDAESGEVVSAPGLRVEEVPPASILSSTSYPNPFRLETAIDYELSDSGPTMVTIYNVLGQPVRTLVDEWEDAGKHVTRWDGTDARGRSVPAGEYFYRLATRSGAVTRPIVLLH